MGIPEPHYVISGKFLAGSANSAHDRGMLGVKVLALNQRWNTHGAGLALGLTQKLRNEKKTLPSQLIFEYPGMFHVWIAVIGLKEAQHAIGQIAKLISDVNGLAEGVP